MNVIPIHPKACCPICKYGAAAATGPNPEDKPSPGSLAVCLNCASLNQYRKQGEYLILVALPDDILDQLSDQFPEAVGMIQNVQCSILSKKAQS